MAKRCPHGATAGQCGFCPTPESRKGPTRTGSQAGGKTGKSKGFTKLPRKSASGKEVLDWWGKLTPQERQQFAREVPEDIRKDVFRKISGHEE